MNKLKKLYNKIYSILNINNGIANINNEIANIKSLILSNRKEIRENREQINIAIGIIRENEWSHIFNNTIIGSSWLKDASFSPGRWAVGYSFLYVLYRILNEVRPNNILELGLGQSTKMISQYVSHTEDTKHWVVEHDQNWISFFSKNYQISNRTSIIKLPWDFKTFKEAESVRCYKDFSKHFKDKKFDFICIDGPLGADMKLYARIDILSIIPDALNDNFIIMIDDSQRRGEINMIAEVEKVLQNAQIEYSKGLYHGEKQVTVICSSSLNFVTSM